jgi:hypothetical protein
VRLAELPPTGALAPRFIQGLRCYVDGPIRSIEDIYGSFHEPAPGGDWGQRVGISARFGGALTPPAYQMKP